MCQQLLQLRFWVSLNHGSVSEICIHVGKQVLGICVGSCSLVLQDLFVNFKTFDIKLHICLLYCCGCRLQNGMLLFSWSALPSTPSPPPNNREISVLGQ